MPTLWHEISVFVVHFFLGKLASLNLDLMLGSAFANTTILMTGVQLPEPPLEISGTNAHVIFYGGPRSVID